MSKKGQNVALKILLIRRSIIDSDNGPRVTKNKLDTYHECLNEMKKGGLISEYDLDRDMVDP